MEVDHASDVMFFLLKKKCSQSLCGTKYVPGFVKETVVNICTYLFCVCVCVSQVSTIFSCIFLCLMSIINKDGKIYITNDNYYFCYFTAKMDTIIIIVNYKLYITNLNKSFSGLQTLHSPKHSTLASL